MAGVQSRPGRCRSTAKAPVPAAPGLKASLHPRDPPVGISRGGDVATAVLDYYKRAISPWLPRACRFEPTCSVYMTEAIEKYGVLHGGWLGVRRLFRCHPLNPGGWDPIP